MTLSSSSLAALKISASVIVGTHNPRRRWPGYRLGALAWDACCVVDLRGVTLVVRRFLGMRTGCWCGFDPLVMCGFLVNRGVAADSDCSAEVISQRIA